MSVNNFGKDVMLGLKKKLEGFNNLTKKLGLNIGEVCYAKRELKQNKGMGVTLFKSNQMKRKLSYE